MFFCSPNHYENSANTKILIVDPNCYHHHYHHPPPVARHLSPTNTNTHGGGSGNRTRGEAAWPRHNITHPHPNHAVARRPSPTHTNTHDDDGGGGGGSGNRTRGAAAWPRHNTTHRRAAHRGSLLAAMAAATMTTMMGSGALRPRACRYVCCSP